MIKVHMEMVKTWLIVEVCSNLGTFDTIFFLDGLLQIVHYHIKILIITKPRVIGIFLLLVFSYDSLYGNKHRREKF